MRRIGLLVVAACLAAPAAAQGGPCVFQIVPSQSSFSISGTTSVGPLVANPSSVQVSGNLLVDLATEGSPASTGQVASGDAAVQNINVFIPNVLPFLPPLADIDVTNLHISPTSEVFLGGPTGAFSTTASFTVLSGTAAVTPLVGTPSVLDLQGATSDPEAVSGSVSVAGDLLTLSIPLSSTIPLDDPTSGISGSVTLSGTLVATAFLSSGCNTTHFASVQPPSMSAGGTQAFFLDGGPSHAGSFYWTFGSFTGTSPGFQVTPTVLLPLNFDDLFLITLTQPFNPAFTAFAGFLDADGLGQSGLTFPPGSDPGFAGVLFHFAYVTVPDLMTVDFASNAVGVVFEL